MTAEPTAVVVAVDQHQWHVLCPYCGEIHHHGAGGRGGYRTPHCRTWPLPPDYRVVDTLGLTEMEPAR